MEHNRPMPSPESEEQPKASLRATSHLHSPSVPQIVLVLAFGLATVYTAPYLIPVHDGLSFSYMLGYSNRAAILLLAAFVLGFALWTRGLHLVLPNHSGPGQSHRNLAWLAILASTLGAAVVWIISTPIVPLGEAQYFLDRYAMYGMGAPLYRGFEFDYGPLMFYLPVAIARIGHLSLPNAYFAAFVLQWALGTWLLWVTVRAAARGTSHARSIFCLLWIFFLLSLPGSGVNYTPLRFCLPLAAAVAVHALYERRASLLLTFATAVAGASAALFYSPEQGIVFTVGTLLFFGLCLRTRRPGTLAALVAFAVAMGCVLWVALRTGDLDNLRTVGGGSLNFPILFSFQSLVVLVLIVLAGCVVIAAFRTRASGHLLLYLICLSAVAAPAAFSRADVGHMIINMLGAILAVFVVVSQYSPAWRWTWSSFALVLLLMGYATYQSTHTILREQLLTVAFQQRYHSAAVERALVRTATLLKGRNAAAYIATLRHDHESAGPDRQALPFGSHLLAPLGVPRRTTPFPGGLQIVTGRYPWLFPMTSRTMLQEKIDELQGHPDWPLILPATTTISCVEDPVAMRTGMKRLLFVPYMPHIREKVDAAQPLCDFLNATYAPSLYDSPAPGYAIWLRKPQAAVPSSPTGD